MEPPYIGCYEFMISNARSQKHLEAPCKPERRTPARPVHQSIATILAWPKAGAPMPAGNITLQSEYIFIIADAIPLLSVITSSQVATLAMLAASTASLADTIA